MNNSVDQEAISLEMVRSQKAAIYTKLESFQPAATEVCKLLTAVCEKSRVEVLLYKDYQKGSDNLPLSVVVVIDARQTRTLITPERGDRNVDHVEELAKLEKETSPTGSILIVIYGDEHSNNLSEEEYVAKHWLQSWKFNDTLAYDLALNGRCFSINKNFNKKQEEMLRKYFQWVPIIPDEKVKASTVVVGEKGKKQVLDVFKNNPFYRALPTDGSETSYGYFSFSQRGKLPTFKMDFKTAFPEIKVCESNDFRMALVSQLKDLNTAIYGTTPSKKKRRTYDNAILSCHCSECYKILMKNLHEVKALIKREAFGVKNVVVIVVSEGQNHVLILTTCQSVKRSWWNKMRFTAVLVILLLLIVLAVSIIVSFVRVAPVPMTTLTPNTTSIANATMTSPPANTTLPTNLTTAENGTSILPTNDSVTTMPTPLTNLTTVGNSTPISPTNDSVTTLPSNDTTNTTM